MKHKWREFLQTHGFACPKTYTFSPDCNLQEIETELGNFNYPIVIKPTDSSGSKGVSMLENLDNLERAIQCANCYSR